jgi:hypothetical protein
MPFKRTNLIELINLKNPLQKNTELLLHLSLSVITKEHWNLLNDVLQTKFDNTMKEKTQRSWKMTVKDKTQEKYHNVSHFPSTLLHLQGDPNMNSKHDGIVD